jgi:feruloyl-CoA synthase
VDPEDVSRGFVFDGRVSEDFKLSTGTWVNFATVRKSVIDACAPFIRDVVLTGADRNYLGALIFPDLEACRRLACLPPDASAANIVEHPLLREKFVAGLGALARMATGSSNRLVRALIMAEPPNLDLGEVTDKGSINQRAVLAARKDLVERLHAEQPGPGILHFVRELVA